MAGEFKFEIELDRRIFKVEFELNLKVFEVFPRKNIWVKKVIEIMAYRSLGLLATSPFHPSS